MRAKTKRQEAIAKVADALFVQRLSPREFLGVVLKIGEIYMDLGEPFVTINRTTHQGSFNLLLDPQRQTKKGQRVQAPPLAMDHSAFIQGRQKAEVEAQGIVASWAKAGIPPKDVWDILDKITPGKKRFIAQVAREHAQIVSTIEAQRETCYQVTRLVVRDNGLMVLPSEVRGQIATATISAVETCTTALSKLVKAGKIIEEAKREFVHVRSRARRDAEAELVRLREKHIKEQKATRAHRTFTLLKAFDPETPWNANSIRAGRVYRTP